jgi:integrase/recombinase XerD
MRGEEASETERLIAEHLRELEVQGYRALVSRGWYLKQYRKYLEAEGLELGEVDARAAEAYQTSLATEVGRDGEAQYRAKTVVMLVWSVRALYEWLRERGEVARNPFRDVPRMKVGKRTPREVPSADELCGKLGALSRFWEAEGDGRASTTEARTKYRVHVMAEVLYATGMRIGELGALIPGDIDVERGVVHIRDGKGALARSAYLNEYAAAVLELYLVHMRESVHYWNGHATVFGTKDGQSLGGQLNVQLRRYVGMTSHGFRHAVGTQLLSSGCDLRMIQLILGHEDLKSTAIYAQVVKDKLRDEVDRCHPRGSYGECGVRAGRVPGEPAGAGTVGEDGEGGARGAHGCACVLEQG